MNQVMNSFIDRVNYGHPYLLLGQEYLSDTVTDIFYQKVSKHLEVENVASDIYLELEERNENVEDILQWIQTEADYAVLPDWGKYIAKVQWNGIKWLRSTIMPILAVVKA